MMFKASKDGGPDSTVWMYGIEVKWLFSILLLRFEDGSRDAYHSHAFDCVSWKNLPVCHWTPAFIWCEPVTYDIDARQLFGFASLSAHPKPSGSNMPR